MKINTLTNKHSNNSISFSGLRPNRTVCNMLNVTERLKLIPTVKHKNFDELAILAQENALHGNNKPQMLVEIMTRFVTGVEEMIQNGLSLPVAFKKNARQLYKDWAGNQHEKNTYSNHWEYLSKLSTRRNDGFTNGIKPIMEKTDKKIAFTYVDLRDMFEFLRQNWSRGNAAYRNIMLGKGPIGWAKYLREELFPNHYDEFFRKY